MSTDLMDWLERALERVDLDMAQAARVLDVSQRTIARWLHEDVRPWPGARERLLEFLTVLEHLSKTLARQPAHDWLFTPNPLLSHREPADLLREGGYRDVLGAIDQLAEGVFI